MKIMAVELNKPMVYGLLPHPPIVTLRSKE
jgi:hypothetical protein